MRLDPLLRQGVAGCVVVKLDVMNPANHPLTAVDPWELHLLLVELKDWELSGGHHMHKSLQFHTCQQALRWHALAQALSKRHGCNCLFYLGNVGNGRIETDILCRIQGHLTRADLDVAVKLNGLEKTVRSRPLLLLPQQTLQPSTQIIDQSNTKSK